ncbi:MAG: SDR family oxidoreductase, partial [Thermoleophilaceae bacterium]
MASAIVTGASRGLGLALARALATRRRSLVIDARGEQDLETARAELAAMTEVVAVAGDVTSESHRRALVAAAGDQVDLLVNNAGGLGPSPLPRLERYPLDQLEVLYRVNTLAPLRLIQLALPLLSRQAAILNITSDAAVEAYEGWGG